MPSHRFVIATIASQTALAALLSLGPAQAQTIITGTHTGANGQDTSGNANGGSLYGFGGNDGAYANGGVIIIQNATLRGGNSGRVTGTSGPPAPQNLYGGQGASGVDAYGTSITVNSGTFRSGNGGNVDGVVSGVAPSAISGGNGGEAFYGNAPTITINGGTFQGGAGGSAGGTFANGTGGNNDTIAAGPGGTGALINPTQGTIFLTVNGGTFLGGAGGSLTGPSAGGGPSLLRYGGGGGEGLTILQSTASIYGGTFTSGTPGSANGDGFDGNPGYGVFGGGSVITFYGSHFTFNGVSNFYGILDPSGNGSGSFTGTLADNAAPGTYTFGASNATFILAPTPEPSQTAALGLGLLGLAGLAFKARKRA